MSLERIMSNEEKVRLGSYSLSKGVMDTKILNGTSVIRGRRTKWRTGDIFEHARCDGALVSDEIKSTVLQQLGIKFPEVVIAPKVSAQIWSHPKYNSQFITLINYMALFNRTQKGFSHSLLADVEIVPDDLFATRFRMLYDILAIGVIMKKFIPNVSLDMIISVKGICFLMFYIIDLMVKGGKFDTSHLRNRTMGIFQEVSPFDDGGVCAIHEIRNDVFEALLVHDLSRLPIVITGYDIASLAANSKPLKLASRIVAYVRMPGPEVAGFIPISRGYGFVFSALRDLVAKSMGLNPAYVGTYYHVFRSGPGVHAFIQQVASVTHHFWIRDIKRVAHTDLLTLEMLCELMNNIRSIAIWQIRNQSFKYESFDIFYATSLYASAELDSIDSFKRLIVFSIPGDDFRFVRALIISTIATIASCPLLPTGTLKILTNRMTSDELPDDLIWMNLFRIMMSLHALSPIAGSILSQILDEESLNQDLSAIIDRMFSDCQEGNHIFRFQDWVINSYEKRGVILPKSNRPCDVILGWDGLISLLKKYHPSPFLDEYAKNMNVSSGSVAPHQAPLIPTPALSREVSNVSVSSHASNSSVLSNFSLVSSLAVPFVKERSADHVGRTTHRRKM